METQQNGTSRKTVLIIGVVILLVFIIIGSFSLFQGKGLENVTVEEEGIQINFTDGYELKDEKHILFGPLEMSFGPIPSEEEFHIYSLEKSEQRSAEDIIQYVNEKFPPLESQLITLNPSIEKINNYSVVKWAEGGIVSPEIWSWLAIISIFFFHHQVATATPIKIFPTLKR